MRLTFAERKEERRAYFLKYIYGWKLRKCSACSGSGWYDNDDNPPCGACDGTGRERYPPMEAAALPRLLG